MNRSIPTAGDSFLHPTKPTKTKDHVANGANLRHRKSRKRDDAADKRDVFADKRDAKSDERDKAADAREVLADERDRVAERADRLAGDRSADAGICALTGAYLRGPGMVELQREMERASRTTSPLVVAFVDVDSLKRVNDVRGRAAGDRVLMTVVETLVERLRPYDRIVRYGGNEFVCILSDISENDASRRLAEVNACLSWGPDPGSISFGVATMVAGDTVASLVSKAEAHVVGKVGLEPT